MKDKKLAISLGELLESSIQDQVRKAAKDPDLKFEKADPNHAVCSIAFSEKNQSWIGFSHRAVAEFKKGDMVFDPDWKGNYDEASLNDVPIVKRGAKVIKVLDDAKEAAKNFARWVS